MSSLLDLSVADVDAADAGLPDTLLRHFGATPERVQTDPRDDQEQFDDQRGEQTVTLLQLLGYLDEPDERTNRAGRFEWAGEVIDAAWARWRQDRLALAFAADPGLVIKTELDGRAIDRADRLRRDLKACATLEGEVELTRWPQPGVTSLASRILLMRLRVYGLCDDIAGQVLPADTALPDGLDVRLLERARWINAKLGLSATDIINHLGSIALATATVQHQIGERFVVLQAPDSKQRLRSVDRLDARGTARVHALNLKHDAMADWNRFSLRLLQVRLWTMGFYRGEIDGDWAQLSHDALRSFFKHYDVADPHRWCGAVQGGYVVLDIAGVLALFSREVDGPADELQRRDIDTMLARPEVQESEEFWTRLAGEHDRERAESEGSAPRAAFEGSSFVVESRENLRRKRYFGWRGIFASFGRLLRKVADTGRRFIRVLLDAIRDRLGFVRNFVRYIVDATRAAVRVAALAVRRVHCWLTGTPVVTEDPAGVVLTLWHRDFDTINVVGTGSSVDLVARHARVLDWMQRSIAIMLEIGTQVVRAVVAIGNWLLLAWQLLKMIRGIVRVAQDPIFAELLADTAAI